MLSSTLTAPSSKVQETGCPPPARASHHQLVYTRHMLQTAPTLGQKTKYKSLLRTKNERPELYFLVNFCLQFNYNQPA